MLSKFGVLSGEKIYISVIVYVALKNQVFLFHFYRTTAEVALQRTVLVRPFSVVPLSELKLSLWYSDYSGLEYVSVCTSSQRSHYSNI